MLIYPIKPGTLNSLGFLYMSAWPDLGPHCSYIQATKSVTGIKAGVLVNDPNKVQYDCMLLVYQHIIVPVCDHFGIDPNINSFFRNPATNTAVGGSDSSQHKKGQAVDLDYDTVKSTNPGWRPPSNLELFRWIKENLSWDQMIFEFYNPDQSPAWVHVSFVSLAKNRKQILKAIKVPDPKHPGKFKTEYIEFN